MKNKQTLGSICALTANIIFGFSFLFSKVALSYANPLIILAVRFTVAFAVLNILWLLGIIKLDFNGKPKRKIILMAIAQPLLYFIFELYGINSTSSAISGVIISLVPVAVLFLSTVFLKEKPSRGQVAFSLLSLAAITAISILSNDGAKSTLIGIILLLGAVICAAVFNILSRSEAATYSPFERTYMMFLVGTVGFNIIALAGLGGNYTNELIRAITSPPFWGAIAYLSVFSSIAAFMLYNYSTSVISAVRSASFSNIITVVSVLAGILILRETLSPAQLVFCTLIIIGVLGVNKSIT